ncbi:hypothetical protein FRC02_006688 [Tulasnella sp. 418]|nr:hypothetical protein FRC02_006688 [Tulasnella sp. 418]
MHNGSSPPDLKVSSRDAGPLGGGGREIEMADGSSSGTAGEGDSPESPPFTAPPLVRSTTPDVFVSDYQPVPLSRVNTLPTNSGPSYPSESPTSGHARTNSAGTAGFGPVLMGPPDYIPPRSESRMKQRLTGLKAFVQTLKGKS